jgi:hypothetical protein
MAAPSYWPTSASAPVASGVATRLSTASHGGIRLPVSLEGSVTARPELGLDRFELPGSPAHDLRLALPLEISRHLRVVHRLEAVHEAVEEAAEDLRIVPSVASLAAAALVIHRFAEELDGAPVPHEVGEALVEVCLAGWEERRVGDLVDHRVYECQTVCSQRRREHRVRQPTECAERRRGSHPHVVALLLEHLGVAAGPIEMEVTSVGNATHDREPPGLPGELKLRCRGDDQQEGVGLDPGVAHEAVAGFEAQLPHCERPGVLNEAELLAHL